MSRAKPQKHRLVQETAEKLREMILETEPDTQLGSLRDVAEQLSVGIVTVQQAARILEHEGLLAVKRGPGGGYYGTRPDDAALERAFATYMRIHDISYRDAFELSVLLDCEIIKSAAKSYDMAHEGGLTTLLEQLAAVENASDVIAFEQDFRETLLEVFHKPLLELLSRVAMQLYIAKGRQDMFRTVFALEDWKDGRQRILKAILNHDPELAYFEAQRFLGMTKRWMGSD